MLSQIIERGALQWGYSFSAFRSELCRRLRVYGYAAPGWAADGPNGHASPASLFHRIANRAARPVLGHRAVDTQHAGQPLPPLLDVLDVVQTAHQHAKAARGLTVEMA